MLPSRIFTFARKLWVQMVIEILTAFWILIQPVSVFCEVQFSGRALAEKPKQKQSGSLPSRRLRRSKLTTQSPWVFKMNAINSSPLAYYIWAVQENENVEESDSNAKKGKKKTNWFGAISASKSCASQDRRIEWSLPIKIILSILYLNGESMSVSFIDYLFCS